MISRPARSAALKYLSGGAQGLLNDTCLRAGLPTVGLFNPLLYCRREVPSLTDTVAGGSVGCTGRNIQFDREISMSYGRSVDLVECDSGVGPGVWAWLPRFPEVIEACFGCEFG